VTSIVDEADFDAERWYAILRDQKVTVWYTAPTAVGVIYPPQVALVGFGKVVERPWAVRGLLGVRSAVTATLAADHRVSDGHRGALFLAAIERLLSQPEKL
jgi:pyruvate dehydrogenase E2 component (dihydrolipoamide acetyltransferase)